MTNMTSCPSCEIVFKITDAQLKIADGWARCGRCDTVFNALDRIQTDEKGILSAQGKASANQAEPSTKSTDRFEQSLRNQTPAYADTHRSDRAKVRNNDVDEKDANPPTDASFQQSKPETTQKISQAEVVKKPTSLLDRLRHEIVENVEPPKQSDADNDEGKSNTHNVTANKSDSKNLSMDGEDSSDDALNLDDLIISKKEDEKSLHIDDASTESDSTPEMDAQKNSTDEMAVNLSNNVSKIRRVNKPQVNEDQLSIFDMAKAQVESKKTEATSSKKESDDAMESLAKKGISESSEDKKDKVSNLEKHLLHFIDDASDNDNDAQKKLEQEKLEQEKLEQERLEKERLEQERLEQERLEQERLEQERLEQERLEQERLEQERLEQERLEQERLEQERLEQERLEQERLEQERLEKERLEKERLEKERLEKERLEKERLEKEKLEKERLEQERLEQERLEQERLEQERLEQERLEQERLEQKRLEQERLEQERLEQERLEQERLEQERLEQEKLEKKQSENNHSSQSENILNELFIDRSGLDDTNDKPLDFILIEDDENDTASKLSHEETASLLNNDDVLDNKTDSEPSFDLTDEEASEAIKEEGEGEAEEAEALQKQTKPNQQKRHSPNLRGVVINESSRHIWSRKTSVVHKLLIAFAALTLVAQLILALVKPSASSNNTDELPWWCGILDCESALHNPSEAIATDGIAIESVSLRQNPNIPESWQMRLTIANKAKEEKPLPKLKIVFNSENRDVLASRILDIKDYPEILIKNKNIKTIKPGEVLSLEVLFQTLPWNEFGYNVYLLP